jgi:hypothetical protein
MVWKDKINVNIMMNMLFPPAKGNLCDENGKSLKRAIVRD